MKEEIKVEGANLLVCAEGTEGQWLTLINGHTRSCSDFKLISSQFVKAGFRCAMLDNRGSGRTTTTRTFSLEDMVTDVESMWKHFGIDRTSLLGISMGGILAQHLAAKRSETIDRLVLVSTTCSDTYIKLNEARWGSNRDEVFERLKFYVSPEFLQKNRLLIDAMAKQIVSLVNNEQFDERASMQRSAISSFDTRQLLQKIVAKTLVIHGDRDQIILADAASEIHRAIVGSQLRIFEGAGHLLLAERSRQLVEEIVKFLSP
jgi:pimeloyl-ACP methyl ester carboxylesterase